LTILSLVAAEICKVSPYYLDDDGPTANGNASLADTRRTTREDVREKLNKQPQSELMSRPSQERAAALGFDDQTFFHFTTHRRGPEQRTGDPLRDALPFDSFREGPDGLGIHIGTRQSAVDRFHDVAEYDDEVRAILDERGPAAIEEQVVPVKARIRNAVEVPDPGEWNPRALMDDLQNAGALTPEEVAAINVRHPTKPGQDRVEWSREFNKDIASTLRAKGYDAIKYVNKAEDKGSVSYIILDPRDLRRAPSDDHPGAKFDPANIDSDDLLAGTQARTRYG
jgi:hypothetical protein